MYLIALVLPPLAMLMCGKLFQAIVALVLQVTVIGWLPAAIWASFVVQNHKADQRQKQLEKLLREQGR